MWEDGGAGQGTGRQCSSRGQQEATAPWIIEVTGDITRTGRCLGRSWDPGWLVWPVLGAPNREEGEWLLLTALCDHWSGPVGRVADRIPGKWPQAHFPAIGGGAHEDEQWISTKMLRTAYDPCSFPYSVPFWDSIGSCET